MKDKLYKAIVDATQNVFKLMFNISEVSDHPAGDFKCDDEVDIDIGVTGDLQGKVIYRYPVSTSLNIVNVMSGMQFDTVDVFVTSAVSEIANIISGNVLSALSENDMNCDILPPVQCKLDDDKKYEINTSCRIYTAIGEICLEIRLNRAS